MLDHHQNARLLASSIEDSGLSERRDAYQGAGFGPDPEVTSGTCDITSHDNLQVPTQVGIEDERAEWDDRRSQRSHDSRGRPAYRPRGMGHGSDKQDEQEPMAPPYDLNHVGTTREVLERHRDPEEREIRHALEPADNAQACQGALRSLSIEQDVHRLRPSAHLIEHLAEPTDLLAV